MHVCAMTSAGVYWLLAMFAISSVTSRPAVDAPSAYVLETRPSKSTVCYGQLGCFSTNGVFADLLHRPFQPLPSAPSDIKTQFTLYTRQNLDDPQVLQSWNHHTIEISNFNASRQTKILVHGFLANKHSPWVKDMSDRLLKVGDYNIVCVDWVMGAVSWYTQAAVDTRVVGAEIWFLVTQLQKLKGLRNEDIHIIGHSLGAHIAGYAGERLEGLARISGLDPAQPYFEGTNPKVRLDQTDAKFVDVIHTDTGSFIRALGTGGYGISQPCGHVDFYPNGGHQQPNCSTADSIDVTFDVGILEGARLFITCNHQRAVSLYADSIIPTSCPFTAYPCQSYENHKAGLCSNCGNRCTVMGFYADRQNPKYRDEDENKYYLETSGYPRYCRRHYFVILSLSSRMTSVKGRLLIDIKPNFKSEWIGWRELTDSVENFKSQSDYVFEASTKAKFGNGDLLIKLSWRPERSWLGLGILGNTGREMFIADMIKIRSEDGRDFTFTNTPIGANEDVIQTVTEIVDYKSNDTLHNKVITYSDSLPPSGEGRDSKLTMVPLPETIGPESSGRVRKMKKTPEFIKPAEKTQFMRSLM